MKADLSLPENQRAFKALYWGQILTCIPKGGNPFDAVLGVSLMNHNVALSLRPISSITEEEMKEMLKETRGVHDPFSVKLNGSFICYREYSGGPLYKILVVGPYMHSCTADWLRRKGFIIDYAGNSCEEILEAGLAIYRKEVQS